MPLTDERREAIRGLAAGMAESGERDGSLSRWQRAVPYLIVGLRQSIPGASDDDLAAFSRVLCTVYSSLARTSAAHLSETLDHCLSSHALAAGVLAGVYELPPEAGYPAPIAADAAPGASDQTGQYL